MKKQFAQQDDNGNDGRGGFIGGWGMRSAQVERISTSISTQIRGWFWAVVFAVVALAIMFAVILAIGPASVWFIGQTVIVIVVVRSIQSLSDVPDNEIDLAKFLLAVYILFSIVASIAWYFTPIADYWPPFMPRLAVWKLVLIVAFLLIPLTASALMAFSLLAGAVNPATYAPYRARNPSAGLFDWIRPTDKPEIPEYDELDGDGAGGLTADDIAAMVSEAIDKKPIIKRETRIMENRKNGNGLHKSPTPGSKEKNVQDRDSAVVELDTRERDGKRTFHICENGHQSMDVPLGNARHYVERAWSDRDGFGIRAWAQRGISENQQAVIRQMLEIYNLIEPANGTNRETITWKVNRDTALKEFARLLESE